VVLICALLLVATKHKTNKKYNCFFISQKCEKKYQLLN
jgi:hypothetical protein